MDSFYIQYTPSEKGTEEITKEKNMDAGAGGMDER